MKFYILNEKGAIEHRKCVSKPYSGTKLDRFKNLRFLVIQEEGVLDPKTIIVEKGTHYPIGQGPTIEAAEKDACARNHLGRAVTQSDIRGYVQAWSNLIHHQFRVRLNPVIELGIKKH